ncbi:MAG TPA: hypothetical protein VFK05_25145 [Polyangiaceae bacterium]|nr:hypothetical protein [Polyangiaceae bacterium]
MLAFRYSRARLVGLCSVSAALACGSGEGSEGHSALTTVCAPVAPTECPDPAPTYADVAPIFEHRCASCHTGIGDAPWPLDSYQPVADWALVIRDELLSCSMPPRDSEGMTAEERQQILVWVRCGHPK